MPTLPDFSVGGLITLQAGTYDVATTISPPAGTIIAGQGRGRTILRRSTSLAIGQHIVNLSAGSCVLRDVTLDGNIANVSASTTGTELVLNGTHNRAENVTIQGSRFMAIQAVGQHMVLDGCEIIGVADGVGSVYGVWAVDNSVDGLTITGCRFTGMTTAGVFASGSAITVASCYFKNNHLQTSPTGGGQLALSATSGNKGHTVTGNVFDVGGAGASGCEMNGPCTVTGNMIMRQPNIGIVLQQGADMVVTGNIVKNCGNGIVIGANVNGSVVTGNRCYDDQATPTQQWGVLVQTGSSDYYVIANNHLHGNVLGGLSDGGTGTHKTISGNLV